MRTLFAMMLIAGVLSVPLAVAERGGDSDHSLFGRCTAWEHNENGREHGNAENAPPFQQLQDRAEDADQTVEEFCAEVPHPGNA